MKNHLAPRHFNLKRKMISARTDDVGGEISGTDHALRQKSTKGASIRVKSVRCNKLRSAKMATNNASSTKGRRFQENGFNKEKMRLRCKSRAHNEGNDSHRRTVEDNIKVSSAHGDNARKKARVTSEVKDNKAGNDFFFPKKSVKGKSTSTTKTIMPQHMKDKSNLKKLAVKRVNRNQHIVNDDLSKKKASCKDGPHNSLMATDELQRKRKKIIRIDPNDISNKRLDDFFSRSENPKEKKEVKGTEISQNAQFRAIQPTPTLLSFVEDHLLGRRRLIELRRAGYNIKLSAPLDNIPFSSSPEREKSEENVFRNKLMFFAAANVSSSFPPPDLPEIAFAGRSNVGKSSLLNALTRQWGVVRTSDKPGLTQTINFFKLASKLCLVDLPGYGFAYAKDEVKDAWEELVKEYVSTRIGLKRVCLLIDAKWGMKSRDHELIDLMERSETKYQIVLTKTDTIFPINVARRAMQIQENLKSNKSAIKPVMMVSSKSGAGIRSLRSVLANIVRFVK